MATLTIREKKTKNGADRFIVRYRTGGRSTPLVHAGTFKTKLEAMLRKELIANEIAAGKDPEKILSKLNQGEND